MNATSNDLMNRTLKKSRARISRSAMKAFTRGAVKQNGVAIGFPNGRHLYRSRPMQAEEDAAGTIAAHQNSLRHSKSAKLELIVLAQNFVDIFSQVFQVLQPFHAVQHGKHCLLWYEFVNDALEKAVAAKS